MDEEPLVSYVICTYDSEEFIEDNLTSIKNQDYSNQEIIVVDNCSSDSTREIIEENFPEFKLIVMPNSDYGACETFNIGFETAKGEYIAIMDDDVEIGQNWTKKLVKQFQRSNENLALLNPKIKEKNRIARKDEGDIQSFHAAGVLARKKALREANYYDERYFIYGNELELAASLLNLDYRLEGYPQAVTHHKNSKDFDRKYTAFETFYETRNRLWYYWKYYDRYNSLMFSLYFCIKRWRKSVKDGTKFPFLKAILSSFREFHTFWFREHTYCRALNYRPWSPNNIYKSLHRNLKHHLQF